MASLHTEPKEHHTVPQTYLRSFAVKPQGLMVFNHGSDPRVQADAPTFRTVKRTSTIENFYTLYDREKSPDLRLEKRLSVVENRYPEVKQAVRSGNPLTPLQRSLVALLAAVQDARSPNHRANWTNTFDQLLDLSERMIRHHLPDATEAAVDERLRDVVKNNITQMDVDPAPANLSLLMIGAALQTKFAMLSRMNLCILESQAHNFMTSDHPVTWVNPVRFPPDPVYGFNFLHLANEVTYPLSPRHCAYLSYLPVAPRIKVGADVVRTVNARLAIYSREIYARPVEGKIDRQRYALDILARGVDTVIINPLANYACKDGALIRGRLRLREAVEALHQDWNYVVKENEQFVLGLREGGKNLDEVTWA